MSLFVRALRAQAQLSQPWSRERDAALPDSGSLSTRIGRQRVSPFSREPNSFVQTARARLDRAHKAAHPYLSSTICDQSRGSKWVYSISANAHEYAGHSLVANLP